ncbi:MAG: phospho-N-acetylmuramoyl-pentapeptide-transferase [Deltaproteobacteria bacterium]|nr:phospho-N-acetylmuramoyl-pentapeptide-transferase [Deltaproteobacteria bacterium]
MLYRFFFALHEVFGPLNVFRYITFRVLLGMLTALALALFLGPWIIEALKKLRAGQAIREDGPQSHLKKAGTPTMGGTLMLFAFGIATVAWADPVNLTVWVVLGVTMGFGAVGFIDDYLKVTRRNSRGLRGRIKFWSLVAIASVGCAVLWSRQGFDTHLYVPFVKGFHPDLGLFYLPFAVFVVVGASNAVNLTDGLDGLAIGPVITASMTYLIFAYVSGNAKIAEYLQIPFVASAGELSVFCSAIAGAALGFLWYNAYPAQVFMGDVGSLALGGALGMVAVVSKFEIVLALVGGVFVIETLSVVLQVASFKTRRKRIFRMAPIHHHFELKGWAEPKIIVRFWIISIILALLGLTTLKLR